MTVRRFQISALLCVLFALQNSASADLVITFFEDAGDVRMSVSGSGVVPTGIGTPPGATLEFLNFAGAPFAAVSDLPYDVSGGDLQVNGFAINSVQLIDEGANLSDLALFAPGFSISQGNTYVFSGSAIVTGLTLAQLNSGIYSPLGGNGNTGDQDAFPPVSLEIMGSASVPEPTSLMMVGGAILGLCATGVCRRKRKPGPAPDAAPAMLT